MYNIENNNIRPDMDAIEEEIKIFDRPSSENSKKMKNYIYFLENKLKEKYNNKYNKIKHFKLY